MQYPRAIAQLIDSYMKLPGIGNKTATRLAFFTLDMRQEDVDQFAKSLTAVKDKLHFCSVCGNITDTDPCELDQDSTRNQQVVMVVEQPRDVMAIERMNDFNGLYHVLHGVLSPMSGQGPEDLNIASLIKRLQKSTINEVIIATNATPEGEATAMYLSRLIKPAGIKVTRLAHGLAVGADIEYADEITLQRAISGRQEL